MSAPRKASLSAVAPRRTGRCGHPPTAYRRCSQRRWLEISLIDLFIHCNEAPQAARTRSCFAPHRASCNNRQSAPVPYLSSGVSA